MSDKEDSNIVLERFYTIPLRISYVVPRPKRTPRAIRFIRAFIKRHLKSENIWISPEVNEIVWSKGIQKPPRRIKVRVTKDEDGFVKVYPAKD